LSVPAICETKRAGFELAPERGATCTCSEDGTSLACTDTTCQSCNFDSSVCAVNTDYGYTLDEITGETTSFRNVLQYVKGRNETITYKRDFKDDRCEVEVNGEKCQDCHVKLCANDFEGITVSCLNLEGGFAIQTCDIVEAGYLEVFYLVNPSELSGCAPLVMYVAP
jgi:hypothetical protein